MTQKHEFIAVLSGCAEDPNIGDDLKLISSGPFYAVLTRATRPLMALPKSRRQALQGAAKRQAQLEQCMRFGTALPLRSDQWIDEDDARRFIQANTVQLAQLCDRLDRAVQYQITVQWKAEEVLTHFRDAPEIAPLYTRSAITAEALESAVSSLAARLAGFMHDTLGGVAKEVLTLPVAAALVFNAAVLVSQHRERALDQAVEEIDAIWSDGFTVRQIGPAPASSFALLSPVWVSAEQVKRAFATLGLSPGAEEAQIAAARRAALMVPGSSADHVREAAEIVHAASRLAGYHEGFHLCTVWSEDQSTVDVQGRAVA